MTDTTQNQARPPEDEQQKPAREKSKLAEWISIGWKVLLFFGGVFLLLFFVQIGFLPELKLGDLTATLAAVSLMGLLAMLIFAGSFVMPAFIAHGSVKQIRTSRSILLSTAVAGAAAAWAILVPVLAGLGAAGRWTTAILITASSLAAIALSFNQYCKQHNGRTPAETSTARARPDSEPAGCETDAGTTRQSGKDMLKQHYPALVEMLFVAFAFLLGQLIALLYFALTYRAQTPGDDWYKGIFWPLTCLIANLALIFADEPDRKHWWKALGIAAGVLLVAFISITNVISMTSSGIARRLGLGDITPASVFLSKQGCEIVESTSNGALACKRKTADGAGVVCNVKIVSRIGSEVVIQSIKPESHTEVVMKSTEMLGWARPTPPEFGKAAVSEGKHFDCETITPPAPASQPTAASPPIAASVPQPPSITRSATVAKPIVANRP